MNEDTHIPTAAEVVKLCAVWQSWNRESLRHFDAYNTAKATRDAATVTRRLLDEAIAVRDAARVARDAAYTAVREATDAVSAARVAHAKATA
jgi:hypothetical protein